MTNELFKLIERDLMEKLTVFMARIMRFCMPLQSLESIACWVSERLFLSEVFLWHLASLHWQLPSAIKVSFLSALLAVGNGFFKPNISSFLGTFRQKRPPQRHTTIFYMGINIGALLAPLTCGYLAREVR